MFKKSERGLTLIEIIISLAISAILLASILVGRDGLRNQLQLSEGGDQWVQVLSQARTEASNVVGNTNFLNDATAGTTNNLIFGKMVTLTNGSATATVQTLTYTPVSGVDSFTTPPTANSYTVTMPWNVKVLPGYFAAPGTKFLIFGQAGSSGIPSVYLTATAPTAGQSVSQYSIANPPISTPSPTQVVRVVSTAGGTTTVNIDQLGNITRTTP